MKPLAAAGSYWVAKSSGQGSKLQFGLTPADLVFVELVWTYVFTLSFKEKCQGKRERMSDSGARHLSTGSPAIAPCLARAQWVTFFLLSPLF